VSNAARSGSALHPAVLPEREPLWTRDFLLVVASLHLFFLGWSMLFATLPLYLADAPKWQVGWVVGGAYGIAAVLTRMPSGRLADRRGRKPMLLVGGLLTAATLAAHGLSANPLALTPIRLLNGMGMCLFTTAGMATLADVLPASRRGEGMGWYGVFYTATNVYGPWLGATVAGAVGLAGSFLLPASVTLGAVALATVLRDCPRPPMARPAPLLSRSALLPTRTFAALTIAYSVLPAFLALYTKQSGFGSAGLFFFLMGLALVPARWTAGALADRFGRARVIFPGLGLAAAGMLLLAAAQGAGMVYAAALVFGAGFGFGHTGLTILTMDRAGSDERGAAMATFSLAWDCGTLGAFALGFVGDAVGLAALFAASGLLPLAAAAGFELSRRRGSPAAEPAVSLPA
jgi:MFS family permease